MSLPHDRVPREPEGAYQAIPFSCCGPRTDRDPGVDKPLGGSMKPTARLQELGQSLWLDTLTREMLYSQQLGRYIEQGRALGSRV